MEKMTSLKPTTERMIKLKAKIKRENLEIYGRHLG